MVLFRINCLSNGNLRSTLNLQIFLLQNQRRLHVNNFDWFFVSWFANGRLLRIPYFQPIQPLFARAPLSKSSNFILYFLLKPRFLIFDCFLPLACLLLHFIKICMFCTPGHRHQIGGLLDNSARSAPCCLLLHVMVITNHTRNLLIIVHPCRVDPSRMPFVMNNHAMILIIIRLPILIWGVYMINICFSWLMVLILGIVACLFGGLLPRGSIFLLILLIFGDACSI